MGSKTDEMIRKYTGLAEVAPEVARDEAVLEAILDLSGAELDLAGVARELLTLGEKVKHAIEAAAGEPVLPLSDNGELYGSKILTLDAAIARRALALRDLRRAVRRATK